MWKTQRPRASLAMVRAFSGSSYCNVFTRGGYWRFKMTANPNSQNNGLSDEKKHRWWHWWFTNDLITPYRFVKRWWGTEVEYQKAYCNLCKRTVKVRYTNEN